MLFLLDKNLLVRYSRSITRNLMKNVFTTKNSR
jgi:hypothetical protein